MTARDLLQYRITHPNGDTFWKFSSLVNAAIDGKLVVLDGVHRSDIGTLAQLQGYLIDHFIKEPLRIVLHSIQTHP